MTRPRIRAHWIVPCAVVGAMLAALPMRSRAADDAREWLDKMTHALQSRNYDGTFFHLSDGRVETMRIVHRVRAGRVTERLLSLDGSGRELVRNNDELTCYLPDQHTILVEPRQDHGPFLGSLPQFGADVNDFYTIEALPNSHVLLGRPARVIVVSPKDQFRFGYRLWLDETTAMPLKTQLCDSHGQVIEQILFARLDMPENIPDSDLTPAVHTGGMRWVHQGPRDSASPALSAYRASELPPGFRLTVAGAQTLGSDNVPAAHLVYSDGLATVSVFVEANPDEAKPDAENGAAEKTNTEAEPPMQGLARVGSGFAYSTVVQGHQVTAVGEVPAQTVEFIAHSVKSAGGPDLPIH